MRLRIVFSLLSVSLSADRQEMVKIATRDAVVVNISDVQGQNYCF